MEYPPWSIPVEYPHVVSLGSIAGEYPRGVSPVEYPWGVSLWSILMEYPLGSTPGEYLRVFKAAQRCTSGCPTSPKRSEAQQADLPEVTRAERGSGWPCEDRPSVPCIDTEETTQGDHPGERGVETPMLHLGLRTKAQVWAPFPGCR